MIIHFESENFIFWFGVKISASELFLISVRVALIDNKMKIRKSKMMMILVLFMVKGEKRQTVALSVFFVLNASEKE